KDRPTHSIPVTMSARVMLRDRASTGRWYTNVKARPRRFPSEGQNEVMTMTRLTKVTALLAIGFIAGCGSNNETPKDAGGDTAPDAGTGSALIVPPPQPTLAGGDIDKFVDDVPTFDGKRVDGKNPVTVDMVEFQQKVLPADFYASLPAPYNAGT